LKPFAVIPAVLTFLLFYSVGCNDLGPIDDADDVEVTVKVSTTNYDKQSLHKLFPDTVSLHNIASAFSKNFTERRKTHLVDNMLARITALREDVSIMDKIVTRAGCKNPGEYVLPTYAERAAFNGRDAWLVQFTYGLGVPSFGRWKCLAYSIPDLDTLYLFQTR